MFGWALFGLAVLAAVYYRLKVSHKPTLLYQPNDYNQQLVAQLPRLSRHYRPTPWLYNGHLQLVLLGLKKAFAARLDYEHEERLIMADGGTTALHWLGLALPPHTPTLLVLHTITGSPHSMRGFVRDLHLHTGWRVVVCSRRGHGGLPLTVPRLNTLGDCDDLREQIAHIQRRFPDSPLYAAGVSAGSGLLVRYLGEEGDNSPIRAGLAYCPGYDIDTAFARTQPFYSRMMARKLVRTFVTANQEVFGQLATYPDCLQAGDLHSLHQRLYEIAGFDSYASYSAASNPMVVIDRITVPLLVLNAADDPVCVIDNVHEHRHQFEALSKALLVITRRGSHCAYFEGWRADSWANRLAAEYFLVTANSDPVNPPSYS